MIRFSKNFFFLFIFMTLCPLLAFFAWNRYQSDQFMQHMQAHSLTFGSAYIQNAYTKYRQEETQYFERILKSFSREKLTLEQYQTLFDTPYVFERPARDYQNMASVDYALLTPKQDPHPVPCIRFIAPKPGDGSRVVVIEKPVPYQKLRPPGPYLANVYAGDTNDPAALLETLRDPHMMSHGKDKGRPGDGPPGFGPPGFGPPGFGPPGGRPDYRPDFFAGGTRSILLRSRDGSPIMNVVLQSPAPRHMRAEQEILGLWITSLLLLSGCLFSVIAGKYINKNFIGPLVQLSVATHDIHNGELNTRVETDAVKHPDVLRTFENFNQMVAQLREKDTLKKNFISNLTHDLRTPLIAQERTLEMLIKEFRRMDADKLESFFNSQLKNNRHLLMMVNQLLETYQFEEGKIKLACRPVNLTELVDQCFEQLMPLAVENQIHLVREIADAGLTVTADPHCLQRVFTNLIANAVENIPKDCTVIVSATVSAFQGQDHVEIHVRDNGQGMPQAQLAQIFERYTGGSGDTRKIGTGLGLYICKIFIEAHHGRISVESQSGRFTDFKIELPATVHVEEETP